MIRAGIIGATGYTGIELLRLLTQHPAVKICYTTTESYAGQRIGEIYPHLENTVSTLIGENVDIKKAINLCDVIFIALPHGHASRIADPLLSSGKKVIDLGADFRLKEGSMYQKWYKEKPAPENLLQKAVYGLAETGLRETIEKSDLIANPGCYATAAILAAAPLLKTDWIDWNTCILDGKSGISGAGRAPSLHNHFCEVSENFKAYQTAGTHRHTPEIEQNFNMLHGKTITVEFTPHLIPMLRGLFMTAYFTLQKKISEKELYALYHHYYQTSPFIRILPMDMLAHTKSVRGTNRCDIAIRLNTRTQRITVTSVIDNLIKGAAGQAVQNMNLMYQLPEALGLNTLSTMYP